MKKYEKNGNFATNVEVAIAHQSSEKTGWQVSDFDMDTYILMRASAVDENGKENYGPNFPVKVEMKCSLYIIDEYGNEVPVSGLFGIEDKDIQSGIYIDGFIPNLDNTFTPVEASDTLKYKLAENGTYFYSIDNANVGDRTADFYTLLTNSSRVNFVNTWDSYGDRSYNKIFKRSRNT